jgi:hypothetical protein
MTAIVGVLCQDGVVIGTDSSTTFTAGQKPTIEQPSEKLQVVAGRIIIAGTGQVGFGQRFSSVIEAAWDAKTFQKSAVEIGKVLCRAGCEDFAYTFANKGSYGALVAFPTSGGKFALCEFAERDFQPELKTERLWYCSMGSAQPITDPFLAFIREVFWQTGPPTVQEATFAVTWTLDHAVSVNPGGVNGPVRIAVLEFGEKGQLLARLLTEPELEEHRQLIEAAKVSLRAIRDQLSPAMGEEVPRP